MQLWDGPVQGNGTVCDGHTAYYFTKGISQGSKGKSPPVKAEEVPIYMCVYVIYIFILLLSMFIFIC